MTYLKRIVPVLMFLILVSGQGSAQTIKVGEQFTLKTNETATIEGTGIEITVNRIGRKWTSKGSKLDFTFSVRHEGKTKSYSSPLPALIVAGDYEIKVVKTEPGGFGSATFIVKRTDSKNVV